MNSSACDTLRETIYALRKRSASGHHFVPFADLRANVNGKIISEAVSELDFPEHHQHAVVATILDRGLRVFSALALLHQEKHIAPFLENDELDVKLPMEQGQVSRIAQSVSSWFWEEVQWEFISHVFIRTGFHRKIRPEMILPILNEEKLSEGAGGEIFKCKIAQNQQTIVPAAVSVIFFFLTPLTNAHGCETERSNCHFDTETNQDGQAEWYQERAGIEEGG